jgi:hypothetical protein
LRLQPPLAPLRPGSYDFGRDLYFQGIGASGFVMGAIKAKEPPASLITHFDAHQEVAVSLANDLVGLGPKAAPTA